MWGILYNTTSIVSFVALFVLGKVLPKSKYGEKILWVASLAVFIYKTVYYILQNVITIMFFFILKVFIKINQNEKKKVVAFHKDVQYRENFEKVDG